MQDSHKLIIAAVLLGLVALFYCKNSSTEQMTPGASSAQTMPKMHIVTPSAATGGLMPADTDDMNYGPFPTTSQPCATAVPYS